jgi:hypothetical protein
MKYVPPGLPGSIVSVEPGYENFVGGKWLAPTHGKYRLDLAPATAGPITEVADSTPDDVELVPPGAEPEDFSLPARDNLHFVTRSPACVSPNAPGEYVLSSAPEWSTP